MKKWEISPPPISYVTHCVALVVEESSEINNKDFRYSADECKVVRGLYQRCCDILFSDIPDKYFQYTSVSSQLVKDFLGNVFIFLPSKGNFKSFYTRGKPKELDEDFEIEDDGLSMLTKQDRKRIRLGLMSLHGLDVNEWFFLIKNNILCFMEQDKYERGKYLIRKGIEAHVFRIREDLFLQLSFLGLRHSLLRNDFGFFITVIKRLAIRFQNPDFYFILYFFSNFFVDYNTDRNFMGCQRNLQRVFRRRLGLKPNMGGESASFPTKDVTESEEESTTMSGNEMVAERRQFSEKDYCLSLWSFLPNHLYRDTVKSIESSTGEFSLDICKGIAIAAIFFTHSKSRTHTNKKYYIAKGFDVLKRLEREVKSKEEKLVVYYNLGRAYHQFSILGLAESYYKRALATSDYEMKMNTIFNLSLIYKKNKGSAMYRDLLRNMRQIRKP
jgi:hypothetical protein